MAGAALMRNLGHKLVLLDLFDLMGRMTVLTIRQFFSCLGFRRAVDAFFESLVDSLVAGGACRREVFVMSG